MQTEAQSQILIKDEGKLCLKGTMCVILSDTIDIVACQIHNGTFNKHELDIQVFLNGDIVRMNELLIKP